MSARRLLPGTLIAVSLLLMTSFAAFTRAEVFAGLLGFGGDSGKLAKLEFRLKESFSVTSLAWSPDGRLVATSSLQARLVHVWDVQKRAVIKELILGAANGYFHNLSWSPDSRYLAACDGFGGVLHVYNASDFSEVHLFGREDAGGCKVAAFSGDAKQIAILGRNLTVAATNDWHVIKVSDLSKGWGLAHLFNALAYLPGTHTILIGGAQYHNVSTTDKYLGQLAGHVWFLQADEIVPSRDIQAYSTADKHGGNVESLAVSPDGRLTATGTNTGGGGGPAVAETESVHIFSSSEGKLLGAPLDGKADIGRQTGLAYTRDGRFLIVGHADATTKAIHIIDARMNVVIDLVHGSDAVYDVAVDPTGRQFAAGSGTEVLFWSLPARD